MTGSSDMSWVWDLLLRGAVAGVLVFHLYLLALPGPRPAARAALGVFALSLIAYLFCQRAELVVMLPRPLALATLALCVSSTAWLWLAARALFDDQFVPSPWPPTQLLNQVLEHGANVPAAVQVCWRSEQRAHSHEDQDQRADGSQRGASVLGARGQVGDEVQQARHHVTIEQPLGHRKRRLRQHVEKAGDEEERQVPQIVELDEPDSLDTFVGLELARVGRGFSGVLSRSSGERKPPRAEIMRTTVSYDMLTAFRSISVAATT